jgi:acetoacetyl-CoA reductase
VVNVENEVGQIEVLVNNAGIARDGMLHRMTHEQCSLCIGGGMGVAMAVER